MTGVQTCALPICVLCSRCFHSTNHAGHNVSFFIAQQSGGCCDCRDAEVWRVPIGCPHHRPAESSSETPKIFACNITDISNPQPKSDQVVQAELQETMLKTVAYALDFILDTLDYSPDEPSVPAGEADLRLQPSADPMIKNQFCVVLSKMRNTPLTTVSTPHGHYQSNSRRSQLGCHQG